MHISILPKMLIQAKGLKKQGSIRVSRDRHPQRHPSSTSASSVAYAALIGDVPKGHLAVYVGDVRNMRRFVIPISYLNNPLFQDLLRKIEEEFGFEHPMGGLTLPCSEEKFLSLISQLSGY